MVEQGSSDNATSKLPETKDEKLIAKEYGRVKHRSQGITES